MLVLLVFFVLKSTELQVCDDCGGGDDSNGHGDRSPVEHVARASEAAEARGDGAGPNDRHRLPHYKQAVSLLARAPPGHYSPLLAARTCAKLARCHATAGNAWEALLAAPGGLSAAAGRAALGSAEYSACAPLLFLLRCQRAAAAMELGLLSMAQRELSALAQERPLMPPLPALPRRRDGTGARRNEDRLRLGSSLRRRRRALLLVVSVGREACTRPPFSSWPPRSMEDSEAAAASASGSPSPAAAKADAAAAAAEAAAALAGRRCCMVGAPSCTGFGGSTSTAQRLDPPVLVWGPNLWDDRKYDRVAYILYA